MDYSSYIALPGVVALHIGVTVVQLELLMAAPSLLPMLCCYLWLLVIFISFSSPHSLSSGPLIPPLPLIPPPTSLSSYLSLLLPH